MSNHHPGPTSDLHTFLRTVIVDTAARRGISINQVERNAGWSRGTIHHVMRNDMSVRSLLRIAGGLGVRGDKLLAEAVDLMEGDVEERTLPPDRPQGLNDIRFGDLV